VNEQELRALVRDAIARHGVGKSRPAIGSAATLAAPQPALRQHPSHGLLPVSTGADAEGPCVIEPAVPCNHCGYCKSYGH
jgi:hypothetical protein